MGAFPRFHVPAPSWKESTLSVLGDEAHHGTRVLRLRPGDEVEIFDGMGRATTGRVTEITSREIRVDLDALPAESPPDYPIVLAASVPKGKTMDSIVQKATEIGATRIIPLMTDHSVVNADAAMKRLEKWRRAALEACKQCGRNWLPQVEPPQALPDFVKSDDAGFQLVAALSDQARPLAAWTTEGRPSSVSVVIGPEGDFSAAELESLLETGYRPLWLGPHVLRADTAAIYALSLISQCFLPSQRS